MSVGRNEKSEKTDMTGKKEKRKRKDRKKILFQVGLVVFVGFSILIDLLGFLLV